MIERAPVRRHAVRGDICRDQIKRMQSADVVGPAVDWIGDLGDRLWHVEQIAHAARFGACDRRLLVGREAVPARTQCLAPSLHLATDDRRPLGGEVYIGGPEGNPNEADRP